MGTYNEVTNENFQKRVLQRFGNTIEFLEDFKTLKGKIKVKCLRCNTEQYTTPSALLYETHKDWCRICSKREIEKEKQDKFNEDVYNLYHGEYQALTPYHNCKEKVLFLHNKQDCLNQFWVTPDAFLNKMSGCPICKHREGADKLFVSDSEFKERIHKIHKGHIIVLSEYHGNREKVLIKHIDCGRTFETIAGDLLQGKGCRYCAGKMLKTTDQFKQEITQKYGNEYTVLGEYINAKTKVLVKHNNCGYEWLITPTSLLKNRRCPVCNQSYGESEIENFLLYNKINYSKQVTFSDCKDKDVLKFDFSVNDKNGNILSLIEFDGLFHFKPIKLTGMTQQQAIDNLRSTQKRDNIKNAYCNDNDISLLRIKYTEKHFINNKLKPYLENLLYNKFEVPNKYVLGTVKKENIKFIDFMNDLPNGLYPKSWIRKNISDNSSFIISSIFHNDVVISYIKEHNILLHKDYIEKNDDGKYNFEQYLYIGDKNQFSFPVYNTVKLLTCLKEGRYYKANIGYKQHFTINPIEYQYFREYIKYKNIKFEHSYLTIGYKES